MLTKEYLDKNKARRTAFRKELHAYPEVAQTEYETAQRIETYLKTNTAASVIRAAKTGVLAFFDSGQNGETIMLRSDHDALPIQEINNFEHKSTIKNVSHKCGHDGHSTIMLGVAEALTDFPISTGKVILLFQPAEENGWGAQAVLKDENFEIDEIDYAYALHNLPGFEKNQIIYKYNNFTAHIKSLIIKFQGKTAHAAEPEKGDNPDLAISELITYCHEITNNNPAQDDFFLITTIHVNLGTRDYGISADTAELHLTIRAWNKEAFDKNCQQLLSKVERTAQQYSLNTSLTWLQEFHANENNKLAVDNIKKAADTLNFQAQERQHPFRWGEDFGLFTQQCKGAMFGIGAGKDTPALHNPDYDFPDEISETAIQQFYQIIKQHLG